MRNCLRKGNLLIIHFYRLRRNKLPTTCATKEIIGPAAAVEEEVVVEEAHLWPASNERKLDCRVGHIKKV